MQLFQQKYQSFQKEIKLDSVLISDEEGYVYKPSEEILALAAGKYSDLNSKEAIDYIGEKLDKWKELPILTAGKSFKKLGHVLTLRK